MEDQILQKYRKYKKVSYGWANWFQAKRFVVAALIKSRHCDYKCFHHADIFLSVIVEVSWVPGWEEAMWISASETVTHKRSHPGLRPYTDTLIATGLHPPRVLLMDQRSLLHTLVDRKEDLESHIHFTPPSGKGAHGSFVGSGAHTSNSWCNEAL